MRAVFARLGIGPRAYSDNRIRLRHDVCRYGTQPPAAVQHRSSRRWRRHVDSRELYRLVPVADSVRNCFRRSFDAHRDKIPQPWSLSPPCSKAKLFTVRNRGLYTKVIALSLLQKKLRVNRVTGFIPRRLYHKNFELLFSGPGCSRISFVEHETIFRH